MLVYMKHGGHERIVDAVEIRFRADEADGSDVAVIVEREDASMKKGNDLTYKAVIPESRISNVVDEVDDSNASGSRVIDISQFQ